ncbi:MAG: hypothetical protein JSS46_03090 [Proteobacteria bacterium]|nr:hypothetical protein [Pseudomonadota bacterium]
MTTLLAASVHARATAATGDATREIASIHARCRLALAGVGAMAGVARTDVTDLALPGGAPSFAGPRAFPASVLPVPALPFLGWRWRRRAARRWLGALPRCLPIIDSLTEHFFRVDRWTAQSVAGLRDEFEAKLRDLEALHERRAASVSNHDDDAVRALELDLKQLRRPGAAGTPDSERAYQLTASVLPRRPPELSQ